MSEALHFIDSEEFQKQALLGNGSGSRDIFSYRSICMMSIMRIQALGSREFYGGFWKETEIYTNDTPPRIIKNKTWEPNAREVYGNAVMQFYHFLKPKMYKTKPTGSGKSVVEEITDDEMAEPVIKAQKKATELTKHVKTSTIVTENDYYEYTLAHQMLFEELNKYAHYYQYWGNFGIDE